MHKTKIDWADATWNPIMGCLHSCPYCYAEKISKRFSGDIRLNLGETERYSKNTQDDRLLVLESPFPTRNGRSLPYPFGFAPTYHKYRLDDLNKWKNGVNIFVCSMADLFGEWVPEEIILDIFEKCNENPQHNYLFLTKNPMRYESLKEKALLPQVENFWYGSTVTNNHQSLYFHSGEHHCFLSMEPLLEDFENMQLETSVEWVIVGAQSGNVKNAVKPKREWVEKIDLYCKTRNIPLFMKGSLEEIMEGNYKTELPISLKRKRPSPKMSGNCMECGGSFRKSDMTYILTRKGKERGAISRGSICDTCFSTLSEVWGLKGDDNE